MWLRKKQNYILGITLSSKQLALTVLLEQSGNMRIHAYSIFQLAYNEIEEQTLFNSTRIVFFLHEFIQHHKLKNVYAVISLDHDLIKQEITYERYNNKNGVEFLYQCKQLPDLGQSLWYYAAIKQLLILQLQLICESLSISIHTITTSFMTQYYLARKLNCILTVLHKKTHFDQLMTLQWERLKAHHIFLTIEHLDNTALNTETIGLALGQYFIGIEHETV